MTPTVNNLNTTADSSRATLMANTANAVVVILLDKTKTPTLDAWLDTDFNVTIR